LKTLFCAAVVAVIIGCDGVDLVDPAPAPDPVWVMLREYDGGIRKGWTCRRVAVVPSTGDTLYLYDEIWFDSLHTTISGVGIKHRYMALNRKTGRWLATMFFFHKLDRVPSTSPGDSVPCVRYETTEYWAPKSGTSPRSGVVVFHRIGPDSLEMSIPANSISAEVFIAEVL
jgi:hypothetical protein